MNFLISVKIPWLVSQPHTGYKTVLHLVNWRSLAANTLSLSASAKCPHPKDHTCSIRKHEWFGFEIGWFCLLHSILKYTWEQVDLILAENSLHQAAGVGGWGSRSLNSRVKPDEMRSVAIMLQTGETVRKKQSPTVISWGQADNKVGSDWEKRSIPTRSKVEQEDSLWVTV